MYDIYYKDILIKSFRTKREARLELDDRANLCYMLKIKPSVAYSIKKGNCNATRRKRIQRSMP